MCGFLARGVVALPALALVVVPSVSSAARELSFEERVRAQEAIERVYYSHQIEAVRAGGASRGVGGRVVGLVDETDADGDSHPRCAGDCDDTDPGAHAVPAEVAEVRFAADKMRLAWRPADGSVPASGEGFWYLARGRNGCGTGTYGWRSDGVERNTSACP